MALPKYIVTQFIDVDDKIIGPITGRQFILILAGVLILFLLWQFTSLVTLIFRGIVDMGIFATLAFAKINGRPIHFFLLNFVQTMTRPRLRIWNREAYIMEVHEVESEVKEKPKPVIRKEPLTGSRLSDLTLIVVSSYSQCHGISIINLQHIFQLKIGSDFDNVFPMTSYFLSRHNNGCAKILHHNRIGLSRTKGRIRRNELDLGSLLEVFNFWYITN